MGEAAATWPITMKCRNGRTYRVGPSQFGGHFVVEVLTSGLNRPVRNLREREAAIAQAIERHDKGST